LSNLIKFGNLDGLRSQIAKPEEVVDEKAGLEVEVRVAKNFSVASYLEI
jgi:hypothetical protein